MLFKLGVLKNFDTNAGVFLRVLRYFSEIFFTENLRWLFWCKNLPKNPKNPKQPCNIQISIVFSVFVDAEHNC